MLQPNVSKGAQVFSNPAWRNPHYRIIQRVVESPNPPRLIFEWNSIYTVMKNQVEYDAVDLLESGSLEVTVPGLFEALASLRAMYPKLSDESLARIVGLPGKEDVISKAVVTPCGEGKGER